MNGNELVANLIKHLNIHSSSQEIPRHSKEQWEKISISAKRQTVSPYLYYRLRRANLLHLVPPDPLEFLRHDLLTSTQYRVKLENELCELLSTLHANHVQVIALKGTYLSAAVYENPSLRPVNDIDLLVRQCDLNHCDKTLNDMGYGPSNRKWISGEYFQSHHHLPSYTKKNRYPIEIHWTISHPNSPVDVPVEALWQQAREINIYKNDVLVLSPEDLLIQLCIHTCLDNLFVGGLRPLIDISEILTHLRGELNWDTLHDQVIRLHAEKAVYLVLDLTSELLGTSLPPNVLNRLLPEGVEQEIRQSACAMVLSDEHISRNFSKLWLDGSLKTKSSGILNRLFPPAAEMYRKYPFEPGSGRLYLAYLQRLKELTLRYGALGVKIARGKTHPPSITQNEELLASWLGLA